MYTTWRLARQGTPACTFHLDPRLAMLPEAPAGYPPKCDPSTALQLRNHFGAALPFILPAPLVRCRGQEIHPCHVNHRPLSLPAAWWPSTNSSLPITFYRNFPVSLILFLWFRVAPIYLYKGQM